jgi:IclR family pca regulon transcriptional regulator
MDGDDIVYVARVPTSRIMTVTINVGTRFPAYATSMGRVLLAALADPALDDYLDRVALDRLTGKTVASAAALRAELARVRAQGYAIVDQELEEGLRAIAAPIHDRAGTVAGAVNVSAHAARITVDQMRRRLLPPLLTATAAIDADLRINGHTLRVGNRDITDAHRDRPS